MLDVKSTWSELTANLTSPGWSITKVTKFGSFGDLSKLIEVDSRGEILDLKTMVNVIVVRLGMLAAQFTQVTLEVAS